MTVLDLRYRLLDASEEFLEQFGIRDIRGRNFIELLHPSVRERARADFAGLLRADRDRFSRDIIGRRPDETAFHGELTGIALNGPGSQVTELLALVTPKEGTRSTGSTLGADLAALDRQIVEGIAAGDSNAQIARRLHLSRQSVEYRVTAMLRKAGAPSRTALIARAFAAGLLQVGVWPPRAVADAA